MKKKIFLTMAASFIMAASLTAFAQPIPPGPGAERGMLKPGTPGPKPAGDIIKQVSVFNGQVGTWVSNDNFVYDGFYLQTIGEKMLVKFPAQSGAQLKSLAKSGSTIAVNGVADISPAGEKIIRMVSVTAAGQTIYDTPPSLPATPPAEEFVSANSKINALQKNQEGNVTGFVLDNKTVLRVPPHVALQLSQTAIAGANITYTGVKKPLVTGEVSSGSYTVVHCKTITLNGTQYLTR